MSAPKRRPRTARFVIHQGDYGQRLEEKFDQVDKARKAEAAKAQRVSAKSESIKLAKEYDALVDEARESDIVLELVKPPRTVVRMLQEQHEPREDNDLDRQVQVNADTFFEFAVPLCIPDFADGEAAGRWDPDAEKVVVHADWVELAETLSAREWDHLSSEVLDLLTGVSDLPKESLVSRLHDLSKQESKSQNASPQAPRRRLTSGPTTTSSTPSPTSSESGDSAPTAETPTP